MSYALVMNGTVHPYGPAATGHTRSAAAASMAPSTPERETTSHPTEADRPEALPMEAPAGSLVVFDSRVWHETGADTNTDLHRGAVFG